MKKRNIFSVLLIQTSLFTFGLTNIIMFPILSFYEFFPILERYFYKKAHPKEEVEIPSLTLNQKLTLPVVIPIALIIFSVLFIPVLLYCIIKYIVELCA